MSGDLIPGLRSKPGQFPGAPSLTRCLPGSACCSFPPASSPAPRLSVPTEQTQHPAETKADESSVQGRQSPTWQESDPITLPVKRRAKLKTRVGKHLAISLHQLEIRSLVLLTGSSTENNLCIHGQNLEGEVSVCMRQNYRSTAARRSSSSQGDCPTEWCPH